MTKEIIHMFRHIEDRQFNLCNMNLWKHNNNNNNNIDNITDLNVVTCQQCIKIIKATKQKII